MSSCGCSSIEEEAFNQLHEAGYKLMAVPRGCELSGTGRILHRLYESHLSGIGPQSL